MDFSIFSREIEKTGFVLENRVASELKQASWTVISNKYYVDDVEENVREIDILAYKVSKVQHFDVYTVLIISCKKSDENAWALLTRKINLKDPNSDWWPVHAWSNDKALSYQLEIPGKPQKYHESIANLGVKHILDTPSVEVFAFQEMNKKTGKPQNDKPIFSAITSLVKAQAYEMAALPLRKKSPSVYQFNLLSIADTDLIRLMFDGNKIEAAPIDAEHYLARYIVKKREIFARIRFIKIDSLQESLKSYSQLHDANCKWITTECDSFFSGIENDHNRMNVYAKDFLNAIKWQINWRIRSKFSKQVALDDASFIWMETEKTLNIYLSGLEEDEAKFLNECDDIGKETKKALKKFYRYTGDFTFTDFPF
ncbi:hypothetical protein [Paraburkholderia tropica]|uniref:hypothetical protein n=1 Tax=Paraburkholderia tropica TaxID=92647 RepID=UPI002AB6AC58|nr:hypothetical protein [Paraburkholderia tropica]